MKTNNTIIVLFILTLVSFSACNSNTDYESSSLVKVLLRDVGHQLLLQNQDTTSLVLPIVKKNKLTYSLSFSKTLEIEPTFLVGTIKNVFNNSKLGNDYLVEVIRCSDNEVSYSYVMKEDIEEGIIPCVGRSLPKDCYNIQLSFKKIPYFENNQNGTIRYYWILILLVLLMAALYKIVKKRNPNGNNKEYTVIGSFYFYPEQHLLVRNRVEINLSKKEGELLQVFMMYPNQTVKREVLTKKVWEDNGVVVGRSLDTYISKLRKKLASDTSIKLTNVHGVGYKLTIL